MSQAQLIAIDSPASTRSTGTTPIPRADSAAAFSLRVSRQFAQARRENSELALLWIDATLVASHGQALEEADRESLMQMVGLRLRNRVRGTDEVVRMGENCFAVLLAAAGAREADTVGLRLLQTTRGSYGIDDRLMQVDIRMGKATFPDHARNGADLAEAAKNNLG
jgi:GGDEF domain-containing protein